MANGRDLEVLLAAVNAASAKARITWIALLSFGSYLAVAVGATTHRDLFLESPISLPILGVDLPLIAFYVVAPFLFLIMHLYLLVNLYVLGRRIHLFEERLPREVPVRADQERVRARLDPFIVLLHVAGRISAPVPRLLLALTVWITVIAGPVVLLIAFQVQFLPYQSAAVAWVHRGFIFADLMLLWLLWPSALHSSGRIGPALAAPFIGQGHQVRVLWQTGRPAPGWGRSVAQASPAMVAGVLSLGVLIFGFLAATVPDEDVEQWIRETGWFAMVSVRDSLTNAPQRDVWWLTGRLFEGRLNEATARLHSPFSRSLVLPDADLISMREGELGKVERTLTLRARNLRYAILIGADMRKVEFVVPDLRHARLERAKLTGAQFTCDVRARERRPGRPGNCPQLQGASLDRAELQGASLDEAQLQGALLYGAQLQGASLQEAQLQGASLHEAQLQGAKLVGAQLQGAWLDRAQLQGALFDVAQLQGASLDEAQLQGATLVGAQLQGALLDRAQLQGASLDRAQLQGAVLHEAQLQGASLDWAGLWRADISYALDTTLLSCIGSHFDPLTAKELDELDAGLKSIPETGIRQLVQDRVMVLRYPAEAVDEAPVKAAWEEASCPQYDPQQSDKALADFLMSEVICHSDMVVGGKAVGAVGVLGRMHKERFGVRPYHARVAQAVLQEDRCEAVREALSAEEIAQVRGFLDRAKPVHDPASPPGKPAVLEPDPAAVPAVPAVDDAPAHEKPSAP